jgi:hypothetical protein
MTSTYYELGLSGHAGCVSCDLAALYRIGEGLPPGSYWIQEHRRRETDLPEWSELSIDADWGTLEVRGPGDWTLRSLAGVVAGPGYIVV